MTTLKSSAEEHGNASIEFIWLALILLVPMMYILLVTFEVQRAAFGVSAASRAAARSFVLAPTNAAAEDRARNAALITLADHRVENSEIEITCEPRCHQPGSTVKVSVRAQQRLPMLPLVFGEQLGSIRVTGIHMEPFGSFRQRS